MCGIVAAYGKISSTEELLDIRNVLYESKIRGLHGSGFSWFDGEKINIKTYNEPIVSSINKFDLNSILFDGNKIAMIAHIRYCTSDINYMQPLGDENISIVHNGVVTQAPPEEWKDLFGVECETKNDSEILLKSLEKEDFYKKFENSSVSMLVLIKGEIFPIRNGYRPLWKASNDHLEIYGSTQNILIRGLKGDFNIEKISPVFGEELIIRTLKLRGYERN